MPIKKYDMKGLQTASESSARDHLNASELKKLDEICSDSQRSLRPEPESKDISDPNNRRFISTNLVLLTNGVIGLLINMLLVRGSFVALFILPVFSCFVYEWNRLHGITLSRAFRPVVNVASVLATYKNYDPLYQSLYADEKDKIRSCLDGPELKSELPRTPESSPPKKTENTNASK